MGLTCPTHDRLHEFTKDGSRSLTCPPESAGPTCPTRYPLRALSVSGQRESYWLADLTLTTRNEGENGLRREATFRFGALSLSLFPSTVKEKFVLPPFL